MATPVQVQIVRVARETGLPESMIRNIARGESNFSPTRRSPSGNHIGVWQVEATTATRSASLLDDFNEATGRAFGASDLELPRVNATVTIWIFQKIKRAFEAAGVIDWTSRSNQALFYWSWLSGWSPRAGAIALVRHYGNGTPAELHAQLRQDSTPPRVTKHLRSVRKVLYAHRIFGIPPLPDPRELPVPSPPSLDPSKPIKDIASGAGAILILALILLARR